MPEICRFLGIVIYMNWRNQPPAHFHAVYGEHEALMTFDGMMYAGFVARQRALDGARMVSAAHRDELETDWALAVSRKPLNPIELLE